MQRCGNELITLSSEMQRYINKLINIVCENILKDFSFVLFFAGNKMGIKICCLAKISNNKLFLFAKREFSTSLFDANTFNKKHIS